MVPTVILLDDVRRVISRGLGLWVEIVLVDRCVSHAEVSYVHYQVNSIGSPTV